MRETNVISFEFGPNLVWYAAAKGASWWLLLVLREKKSLFVHVQNNLLSKTKYELLSSQVEWRDFNSNQLIYPSLNRIHKYDR